jgi:hypothetical protein
VQSFDTDMFRLFGQITGDPDFDLLRIVGGTDFGLPSPGHTTLTQLPGGQWAVDSFFDITYRIDYVGAPGGPFAGMSGSTTGTIRMGTGPGTQGCVGACPPGTTCVESRVVNADGTYDICCDCLAGPPPAAVVGVVSRKFHSGPISANQDIVVGLGGSVELCNVTTEPRQVRLSPPPTPSANQGGISRLVVTFNIPPGGPGTNFVSIEEQSGPPCGTLAAYAPYGGASVASASVAGNDLTLDFTPPLEDCRTYRFTIGPDVTSLAGQSFQVRSLRGDCSAVAGSYGITNGADRSAVLAAWTGPGYTIPTDITLDGVTNGADRSAVLAVWTSACSRAP